MMTGLTAALIMSVDVRGCPRFSPSFPDANKELRIASCKPIDGRFAMVLLLCLLGYAQCGAATQVYCQSQAESPPQAFLVTARSSIRVLAFGDFGEGNEPQKQTAAAMVAYHRNHPFDFGITLGDNFYPIGIASLTDPRWKSQFEDLYGPMGIKIYATLGNHDYYDVESPTTEIAYTKTSADWRLESSYYTFTAGPVQFFAIDTVCLSQSELDWLARELASSTARWKLVYGHYPIYSATEEDRSLIRRLLPVLKSGGVDVYLSGHHHNLQVLKPDGNLHFWISGGGGAHLHPLRWGYPRTQYKKKANGFTVLDADEGNFTARFIGVDGRELYRDSISK
jgi:tartrate-resistant acid phosphatase type 5